MQTLRAELLALVEDGYPMTVRQVFYRAVAAGLIDKTEREYKSTVSRLLKELRLEGAMPFGWIADSTRWMRKPTTFSSIEEALRRTARLYRRAVWDQQPCYVEVWCEKDALAGVLYNVTGEYDVPLMVTRGYASLSYLHEAAEAIAAEDKPAFIYYLGDFDPSGVDIPRHVEARLREFAPQAEIHFECVAVTPEQIAELALPMRPTKRSDSRSHSFGAESVELDAIPPERLRALAREVIERHITPAALDVLRLAEESERLLLLRMAGQLEVA